MQEAASQGWSVCMYMGLRCWKEYSTPLSKKQKSPNLLNSLCLPPARLRCQEQSGPCEMGDDAQELKTPPHAHTQTAPRYIQQARLEFWTPGPRQVSTHSPQVLRVHGAERGELVTKYRLHLHSTQVMFTLH